MSDYLLKTFGNLTPLQDRNVDTSELDCDLEKVLHGHSFAMSTISWSPNDKLLLSSAEHEIKLWDVEVCPIS
jgi:WD40 repeat protein